MLEAQLEAGRERLLALRKSLEAVAPRPKLQAAAPAAPFGHVEKHELCPARRPSRVKLMKGSIVCSFKAALRLDETLHIDLGDRGHQLERSTRPSSVKRTAIHSTMPSA